MRSFFRKLTKLYENFTIRNRMTVSSL